MAVFANNVAQNHKKEGMLSSIWTPNPLNEIS